MSASRKRKARRAYFCSLGAYAPIRDRWIDPGAGSARVYRVEVQRGHEWRGIAEFGDASVASNHALAVRDNVNARTVANIPTATRVVSDYRSLAPDASAPTPLLPMTADVRPIGAMADKMSIASRKAKGGKRRILAAWKIYAGRESSS